tara:strand:- start:652 stop:1008 length:357 start_codon:yes stop_codon:yes gene_type:complete
MPTPTEDLSQEIRELKRRFDSDDEAFVQRLADWSDWRKDTTRIMARLTTITIGDEQIAHKGLVTRVQEHDMFINDAKDKATETKGSKKTWFFIAGVVGLILGKLADVGFQILTARAAK